MAGIGKDKTARQTFGWGIVGTGRIASDFASDLRLLSDARLVAVLSRDQSSADQFADKWAAAHAYSDIDRFLADPDIDIIYVATPNSMHVPQAVRAIRAGKAVLIEKPLAPSAHEAEVLHREAVRNNVFAMEAMWVRFLPGIAAVKGMIDTGTIGIVHSISASLSALFVKT